MEADEDGWLLNNKSATDSVDLPSHPCPFFHIHLDCIENLNGTTPLRSVINRAQVEEWWEEAFQSPIYQPLVRTYISEIRVRIVDEEEEDVGMADNVLLAFHFCRAV